MSTAPVASCYHTKMVSTSDKARFPHMAHYEFHPDNAAEKAREVVREAVENYPRRGEVYIPVEPVDSLGGFSVEAVVGALGGTPEPLPRPSRPVRSAARWASWAATIPRSNRITAMSP